MNSGGRPYILERPPLYIGAVGHNQILYIHRNNPNLTEGLSRCDRNTLDGAKNGSAVGIMPKMLK